MIVTLDTEDILDAIKSELKITKDEKSCICKNLILKYRARINNADLPRCTEKMVNEIMEINAGAIAEAIMFDNLREWCETKYKKLLKCLVGVAENSIAKRSENDE